MAPDSPSRSPTSRSPRSATSRSPRSPGGHSPGRRTRSPRSPRSRRTKALEEDVQEPLKRLGAQYFQSLDRLFAEKEALKEKAAPRSPRLDELKRWGAKEFQSLSRLFAEKDAEKLRAASPRSPRLDELKRWGAKHFSRSPSTSPREGSTRERGLLEVSWNRVMSEWGANLGWGAETPVDGNRRATIGTTRTGKEKEKRRRHSTGSRPTKEEVRKDKTEARPTGEEVRRREKESRREKERREEKRREEKRRPSKESKESKESKSKHSGIESKERSPTKEPAFATRSDVEKLKLELDYLRAELEKARAAQASSATPDSPKESSRTSTPRGDRRPSKEEPPKRQTSASSEEPKDVWSTAPSALAGSRHATGKPTPTQRQRFATEDKEVEVDLFATAPASPTEAVEVAASRQRAQRFLQQEEDASRALASEPAAFGHFGERGRLPRAAEQLPRRHGSQAPTKGRGPSNVHMAETISKAHAYSKARKEEQEKRASSPTSQGSATLKRYVYVPETRELRPENKEQTEPRQPAQTKPQRGWFSQMTPFVERARSTMASRIRSTSPASQEARKPRHSAPSASSKDETVPTAKVEARSPQGLSSEFMPSSRPSSGRSTPSRPSTPTGLPSSPHRRPDPLETPRSARSARSKDSSPEREPGEIPRDFDFDREWQDFIKTMPPRPAKPKAEGKTAARPAMPRGDPTSMPTTPRSPSSPISAWAAPKKSGQDAVIDGLDAATTPRSGVEAAKLLGLWAQAKCPPASPGQAIVPAALLRQTYRRAAMRWHPDRPVWVSSGEEDRTRAAAAFRRARVAHDLLLPHASK